MARVWLRKKKIIIVITCEKNPSGICVLSFESSFNSVLDHASCNWMFKSVCHHGHRHNFWLKKITQMASVDHDPKTYSYHCYAFKRQEPQKGRTTFGKAIASTNPSQSTLLGWHEICHFCTTHRKSKQKKFINVTLKCRKHRA